MSDRRRRPESFAGAIGDELSDHARRLRKLESGLAMAGTVSVGQLLIGGDVLITDTGTGVLFTRVSTGATFLIPLP